MEEGFIEQRKNIKRPSLTEELLMEINNGTLNLSPDKHWAGDKNAGKAMLLSSFIEKDLVEVEGEKFVFEDGKKFVLPADLDYRKVILIEKGREMLEKFKGDIKKNKEKPESESEKIEKSLQMREWINGDNGELTIEGALALRILKEADKKSRKN